MPTCKKLPCRKAGRRSSGTTPPPLPLASAPGLTPAYLTLIGICSLGKREIPMHAVRIRKLGGDPGRGELPLRKGEPPSSSTRGCLPRKVFRHETATAVGSRPRRESWPGGKPMGQRSTGLPVMFAVYHLRSFLTACRKENAVLTACRKESKASCSFIACCPYRFESATVSDHIASSQIHERPCLRFGTSLMGT